MSRRLLELDPRLGIPAPWCRRLVGLVLAPGVLFWVPWPGLGAWADAFDPAAVNLGLVVRVWIPVWFALSWLAATAAVSGLFAACLVVLLATGRHSGPGNALLDPLLIRLRPVARRLARDCVARGFNMIAFMGSELPGIVSLRRGGLAGATSAETERIDQPTSGRRALLGAAAMIAACTTGLGLLAALLDGRGLAMVGVIAVLPIFFGLTAAAGALLNVPGAWRIATADLDGVRIATPLGEICFAPTDAVLVVEARRRPDTILVRFVRTDGVTRRVTCSRAGFEHLITCWASHARTDAELGGA
jgi:hypothetical protein